MNLIQRLAKALQPVVTVDQPRDAMAVSGHWTNFFFSGGNSSYHPGWWQADDPGSGPPPSAERALAYFAVYACQSLISADVGKLRWQLIEYDKLGLWEETESPAYSPVLRHPNNFQNHIQFKEWWITSKLIHGNTYALKRRDQRGLVVAEYILDPPLVTPLVTPSGDVYYQLSTDNLSGIGAESVVVPATEIIHDRMNCLWHPLIGTSPITACALAADQGLRIQRDSRNFFANSARPSGVLTAPGTISDETATRLKNKWDDNYTGDKAGGIAVLGDGLSFVPMKMSAVDAELVKQLDMSAQVVCACFHVPAYKIGIGPQPLNSNVEALDQQYYSQCLQTLIEAMEQTTSDGLGLDTPKEGKRLGVQLDLGGLLRMDTKTQLEALRVGVEGAIMAPNEARRRVNLRPLTGGDTVYLQQQNYSLEDLDRRSKLPDPFAAGKPVPAPPSPPAEEPGEPTEAPTQEEPAEEPTAEEEVAKAMLRMRRAFEEECLDVEP